MRKLIFIFFFLIVFFNNILSQNDSLNTQTSVNSFTAWDNSFYLASGYSFPMRLSFEGGYNFGHIISISVIYCLSPEWNEGETTAGLLAKLNFQIENIDTYFSIGAGGTSSVLGNSAHYFTGVYGFRIPLVKSIIIRPEIGIVYYSKDNSDFGLSLFSSQSNNTPGESNTSIMINCSLEFDVAKIL